MSLSIQSVMHDLEPMLKRGRPPVTEPFCRCCGQTSPDRFGVCKSRCLECRKEDDAKRRLREKQARDFQQAVDVLRLINSFPPTGLRGG